LNLFPTDISLCYNYYILFRLGEEIIRVEHELLENTLLSNGSTFILQHLSSCPELINYTISNVLINNSSEIIEIALGKENTNLLNSIYSKS